MKVKVFTQTDKVKEYELPVRSFSARERTKNSLVQFSIFFGLALGSVFIPVFHFVLVPLFLLIAPFMAWKTYKQEVLLEECKVICPECQQEVGIPKKSGQWPLHEPCPHCRNRIYFDSAFLGA